MQITADDGSNEIIENNEEKANLFADFFHSVYSTENDLPFDPIPNRNILNTMSSISISSSEIAKKLSSLDINKSPGPDMVHPRILFESRSVIADTLKIIFELSVSSGELPDDWKTSIITVIHKKGRKDRVENYRPISLTCIVCKVFESILKDHIMNHFMSNNLFSSRQYGFIKGREVVLQLLNIINDWIDVIDNGGQIDIIYTDFEKAFNKVPHRRLLSKLESYGLHQSLISWIRSFLCCRTQYVKINGSASSLRDVLSGIPQGTVLGPLLFIIFINDLPDIFDEMCKLFLFADDGKLYRHVVNFDDCRILQDCCQDVFSWSQKWCMSLNIDKCKVLSICKNNSKKITNQYSVDTPNGRISLENVSYIKDLGVIIDNELSFSNHIHEKINTAFRMLGIIKRNFSDLDRYSFMLLYKSLIRSHLEYGVSVWSPYKVSLVSNLERVQKRATKLVKSCKNLNYLQRLKHLNLPTLKYRRVRGDMIEVFKILNDFYDTRVTPALQRNLDMRTRGNSFKLNTIRSRLDIKKFSFCSRVVATWNSLPDDVVVATSLNSFKNKLDRHWSRQDFVYDIKSDLFD